MKFLDVLKRYNNAVIKENAKLKSIYESLISEGVEDDTATDDIKECGESDKTDINEDDFVPAKTFFAANEDETKTDDTKTDTTNEAEMPISEDDFFGEVEKAKQTQEECETQNDVNETEKSETENKSENTNEADDINETDVDLNTFFAEDEDNTDKKEKTCEKCGNSPCTCEAEKIEDTEKSEKIDEDDLMSWDEFINQGQQANEAEKSEKCEKCGNSPCTCEAETSEEDKSEEDKSDDNTTKTNESEDVEENDLLKNKPHNAHVDVNKDEENAELNESKEIDEYRKANYRLFNA